MRIHIIKRKWIIRWKIRKKNRFFENDLGKERKIWKINKRLKNKNRQKHRADIRRQSANSMWGWQCILDIQKKKNSEHGKGKSNCIAWAISSQNVHWTSPSFPQTIQSPNAQLTN